MNHDKIISVFNKQILEFLDQILLAFPQLSDNVSVDKIKQTLYTTIAITPHVLISLFYDKIVTVYEKEIIARDDSFLMQKMHNHNENLDQNKQNPDENLDQNKQNPEQNNDEDENEDNDEEEPNGLDEDDEEYDEEDNEDNEDNEDELQENNENNENNEDNEDEYEELESNSDADDELLHMVKTVYKTASPENKKIIWDYIQRLRLLCIKYYKS